jgi:ribosome-associated protein
MDIRKLQRAIVDGLEDVKAHDIVVFNTEALTPLFERVIIASGTSNRQTKALAGSVRETVKSRGLQVLRTEGEDNGEWIIVDCGAAVAHIMQPAIRDYYHLEELWGGKPVKMKGPDGGAAKQAAATLPAGKPPARKSPKKTTPVKATPVRKAAAKKAPAGKAPAGKAPAGKAPAGKAPAGKTAARKAPARNAPAKKALAAKVLATKALAKKARA